MYAVIHAREDIVDFLLGYDQDFAATDGNGWNIIHCIVSCSTGDHSVNFLKKIKIKTSVTNLINKSNNLNKETPLHIAAYKNNHKAIEWLLANNVDVSIKNYLGLRPDQL